MTTPAFVNQLRARGEPIRIAPAGTPAITVRVEMAEVWDTVKLIVSPDEPVLTVKRRALEALYPAGEQHERFVLKLNGWEVLDESASVAATGAVDGSNYLLTFRNRRPVR
jgi:hypothetical protein